jgi:hypothetical protein
MILPGDWAKVAGSARSFSVVARFFLVLKAFSLR